MKCFTRLATLLVAAVSPLSGQTVVFESARVIVGDGSVLEDGVVIVEDGTIVRTGIRSGTAIPEGANRVSLAEKTLMPLLIDVHGHVGFSKGGILLAEHYSAGTIVDQPRQLEYFGVGAFQSLGTDLGPDAFRVREDQRSGKLDGARLLLARRGFAAPGGGFQSSTLAIQARPISSGWLNDPVLREITPDSVIERLESGATGLAGTGSAPRAEEFRALMRINVSKLKAAGIRIALGTDTGIPTRFCGYNEHLELQALVDAGLTPLEAISAGTSVAAEFLGLDDLGSLSAGKRADFIVLEEHPLDDIRNTTHIAAVYRKGRAIDRDRRRSDWKR